MAKMANVVPLLRGENGKRADAATNAFDSSFLFFSCFFFIFFYFPDRRFGAQITLKFFF